MRYMMRYIKIVLPQTEELELYCETQDSNQDNDRINSNFERSALYQ